VTFTNRVRKQNTHIQREAILHTGGGNQVSKLSTNTICVKDLENPEIEAFPHIKLGLKDGKKPPQDASFEQQYHFL